jgi:hypothetical protein
MSPMLITNSSLQRSDLKLQRRSGDPADGPLGAYSTILEPPTTWTDAITREKGPSDYRRKIRDCENATTYLSANEVRYVGHNDGYLYIERYNSLNQTLAIEYKGCFGTFDVPTMPSLDHTLADNQAKVSLVNQILRAQQSLQGLVFAGELGKTIRGIKRPYQSLVRKLNGYLGSVKRQNSKLRRANKDKIHDIIANSWLETVFGLTPLANDLDGLAHALATDVLRETVRVYAVGSVRGPLSSEVWSNTAGYVTIRRVSSVLATTNVKYYGAIKNRHNGNSVQLHRRLGLTLSDFVPSIYNLIPYSFLVDYATNLGDIVQAACINTSDVAWLAKGTLREASRQMLDLSYTLAPLTGSFKYRKLVWVPGIPTKVTLRQVLREQFNGSLVPEFRFTLPYSLKKWANIAALGITHKRVLKSLLP